MTKVTAGRDYLGTLAPDFAEFNDDVLFGRVWADEILTPKTRSMITISALIGAGIFDESLKGHIATAKQNGVTKEEMVAMVTHLAFYTGWPKGWAAFAIVTEVYGEEASPAPLFGLGELLDDPAHFSGKIYVKEILGFDHAMIADNATFAPGCINNWHIHGVGQILLCTEGKGWYQEEGKPAQALKAGDVVYIPGGVKHWHGAQKDSWFTHVALEDPSKGAPIWLDRISAEEYAELDGSEE